MRVIGPNHSILKGLSCTASPLGMMTVRWIWFIFGMLIGIGQKLYSAVPTSVPMTLKPRSGANVKVLH